MFHRTAGLLAPCTCDSACYMDLCASCESRLKAAWYNAHPIATCHCHGGCGQLFLRHQLDNAYVCDECRCLWEADAAWEAAIEADLEEQRLIKAEEAALTPPGFVYDPEDYFAVMETGPDREALCEYEGYNDAPIGNVLPCGCHPTEGEACPLCEPVPESSDDLPF